MSENRLPSLNALRAFAEVGKHLNLKAAADNLYVTPSALSHQIRALEDSLDVKLFIRKRHGLELTSSGASILPGIQQAFEQLSQTLESIKTSHEQQTLTVSMLSTFAMRWFIPRLSGFQNRHPDIEVRISTSVEAVDFKHEDINCAIRSGDGNWPELHVDKLYAEQLTPVCSPAIRLHQAGDLQSQTLLHANLRPDDWRIWLYSAGVGELKPAHEQTFETRNFAIQAAIDGLGIAVVDPSLVIEELNAGRLVQPFAQPLASDNAYHLVYPEENSRQPALLAFRDWLLQEARK